MQNLDRARNYEKKLYAALGKEWREEFFNHTWLSDFYGQEWDQLYEMGILENDFCALCGNDELKSGYYRIPNFSNYRVQIPICDDCWDKHGYERVAQLQSEFKKSFNKGCIVAAIIVIIILLLLIF
jgi:hypothetical protein